MEPDTDPGSRYHLRTARGSSELEAVYRFRYEHFFRCFRDGYPGLDRAGRRVFQPHDATSTHFCAFDDAGGLCAVSTATAASASDNPESWREWLKLGWLASLGEDRIVISTRLVIHPDHRGYGLFGLFYRFIMKSYLDAGFRCAVHYSSPAFLCRYQNFGHQFYGEAFMVPTGLLRIPMLIDFCDIEYLRRVDSPILDLCGARSAQPRASLRDLLPEGSFPLNFRLLSAQQRLSYMLQRVGREKMPEPEKILPLLEHASLLPLRAGLQHFTPPSGGLLFLVLGGAIRECGSDRLAGPGSFVGFEPPADPGMPSFTVIEDSEVLTFDQKLVKEAAEFRTRESIESPWQVPQIARERLPH